MSKEMYRELIELFEDKQLPKQEKKWFSKCFKKIERDSSKDLTGYVLYTDKVV